LSALLPQVARSQSTMGDSYFPQLATSLDSLPPVVRQRLWDIRQLDDQLVAAEHLLEKRQAALIEAAKERFPKVRTCERKGCCR